MTKNNLYNYLIEAFIEEGYHSTNPYHNSIHATDVTQAMHCFLQEKKVTIRLFCSFIGKCRIFDYLGM